MSVCNNACSYVSVNIWGWTCCAKCPPIRSQEPAKPQMCTCGTSAGRSPVPVLAQLFSLWGPLRVLTGHYQEWHKQRLALFPAFKRPSLFVVCLNLGNRGREEGGAKLGAFAFRQKGNYMSAVKIKFLMGLLVSRVLSLGIIEDRDQECSSTLVIWIYSLTKSGETLFVSPDFTQSSH